MAQRSPHTLGNRSASKGPNLSQAEAQLTPSSSDIVLAWNAAVNVNPIVKTQSEYGQQSEYGGELFEEAYRRS